jgi:glycosyltransferase involved in cell wall biosynthesis
LLKLSVVIITFNEEKNIQRCIDSVKDLADEVVVLDSFSTDNTPEICRIAGARFFQHRFDGHIQQKNRAIQYATYDHVLSLDADEALDQELRASIRKTRENFDRQGYYMNRLTNYCGHWVRHCGWYPDRKLRLFDRRKGAWTGINPHDRYELRDGDRHAGYLKGNILHYSYYNVDDHYRQVAYFTDIASRAYYEKGRKAPAFKLFLNPVAKFVDHFFLKRGFLDGLAGYRISRISAYATWLKYKKLRQLYHQKAGK